MNKLSPSTIEMRDIVLRALQLFWPICVICLCASFFMIQSETRSNMTKLQAVDHAAVQAGVHSIEHIVEHATEDLIFLSQHKGFQSLISRSDFDATYTVLKASLGSDWLLLSGTKKNYDQIRWIDQTGQEKLRVNYNDANPFVVQDSELQNKADRYYFQETIKLNKGELFISPLDLNIEHGKIEYPRKPMIRIGTPVYDDNNIKRGILLVNFFGNQILNEFSEMMGTTNERAWLLNREGYWLKGPSAELEWGDMFKNEDHKVSVKYPMVWDIIKQQKNGQFETPVGLWTFDTIYPLREGQKTSQQTYRTFEPSLSEAQKNEYFWKAVLLLPKAEIRDSNSKIIISIGGITLIVLGLVFFGCVRLAEAWLRLKQKKDELRQVNIGLGQAVEERTKELREEIHERKKIEKQLKHLATHDNLTGLPTRVLCLDHVESAISAAHRHMEKMAILFIDLDGFKAVNDTFGHEVGDMVLVQVADRLTSSVREMDTVARIGGDEFIIILENIESRNDVEVVAEKIIKQVSRDFSFLDYEIDTVGASIGIALYPDDATEAGKLIGLADKAMYKIKNTGKNDYSFYAMG